MFKDILSNAGELRKATDPNNGHVEFGLPIKKLNDGSTSSSSRFIGFPPDVIEQRLNKTCEVISCDCLPPLSSAGKFYQQFVRIHPFYDGNGRIGRFMVDAFLYSHKMYLDWEKMKNKNSRWIKYLNYCHRQMNHERFSLAYAFAIKWWIHHIEKFSHTVVVEYNGIEQ